MSLLTLVATLVVTTTAFPFLSDMPGVDSSALRNAQSSPNHKRQSTCPFNSNHQGAAPYNSNFPYTGARNGLPGTGIGGIKVPATGDTAHAFEAPGPNDIRGPCPGLNTAANHHFLSHDGITNFNELLDAQQNLYNVDYGLAVLLATLGVSLDGDIVTGKVSIGCDATSRTSTTGSLLGDEVGLNRHNVRYCLLSLVDLLYSIYLFIGLKSHGGQMLPLNNLSALLRIPADKPQTFEADTSLTRNDYFLANGDDYSFNGTLFGMMTNTCKGNFNRDNLALYRFQRYQQSEADNGNFYFGPKSLLLYGAASFLYELFPSLGDAGTPDLATISSFFGAESNGNGGWRFNNKEQIPPNWYNRKAPYTIVATAVEILTQYLEYPVLFGGNVGKGNFDALSFGSIKDGNLNATEQNVLCLLYQLATEDVPSSLSEVLTLPLQVVSWAVGKLNPVFKDFGCPLKSV